jgi:hypothetical protein
MLFLEHSKVTVTDLVQVEWLIPTQFACAVQIVLAAHHFIGAVQTRSSLLSGELLPRRSGRPATAPLRG